MPGKISARSTDRAGAAKPLEARWYLLLGAVVILGLVLSYLTYAGPDPWYDDSGYILSAQHVLSGNAATVLSARYNFGFLKLILLALSFGALGYGSIQAILPSVFEFVLLIIITFLIGNRLRGPQLGMLAAFFAATAPFALAYVSRVTPDVGNGLAVALVLYLFLISLNARRKLVLPFLFGVSTILPIYVNDEGFAVAFFVWIYLAARLLASSFASKHARKNQLARSAGPSDITGRYAALALAGAALALFVYFLPFYLVFGQPFYVFLSYNINYSLQSPFLEAFTLSLPTCIMGYCANPEVYPLGPLVILAVIGSILLLGDGQRKGRGLFVFLNWGLFIFLIFGTTHLSLPYLPIPVATRFFIAILAPLSIICAYAIIRMHDALRRFGARKSQVVILGLICLIFILYLPLYGAVIMQDGAINDQAQQFFQAAAFLANESSTGPIAVYTHAISGFNYGAFHFLEFSTGFSSAIGFHIIANVSTRQVGLTSNLLSWNCSLAPNGKSFLVVFYGTDTVDGRKQVNTEINSWLDSFCSSNLLTEKENQTYIYALYNATQG